MRNSFLSEVAQSLYNRYGDDVASLSILFPSRRARLFFTDALSDIAVRPLWQPEWLTVDDLMSEISGLKVGDRTRLIAELYKIYSKYHEEPFDKFYFWGEMLLADFDMVDKYRIPADRLFVNIVDIKELESDLSYLTPEQLQIVAAFWRNVTDGESLTEEKRRFLEVWRSLAPIYHEYRERLTSLGIAYAGMVHRTAADMIDEGRAVFAKPRRYVVAGFNALSSCEQRLFKFMATAADAEFFWDYDLYYTRNSEQEAGMFLRDNISLFPPKSEISHDNFRNIGSLTAVSTVSNVAQCKYVAEILRELAAKAPLDKDTAIVLTDENLLEPLLHSLPKELGKVNVTMGYPLRQSLVYSFVERLLELQHHSRTDREGRTLFYHLDVVGILSHPYVCDAMPEQSRHLRAQIRRNRHVMIDGAMLVAEELLATIFKQTDGWECLSRYLQDVVAEIATIPSTDKDSSRRTEFLAVMAENLAKLHNSLSECEIDLTPSVYISLLRRHLQGVRIPFEGEPLEGVQIMGILETRNLDFRNVILLSMNDDNFPGNHAAQASFVPYNLRFAYGMPTPEHHEGVYAYYFYRLAQRCENLYMLYCSHADDRSTGEPSRYIRQLENETEFDIRRVEVGVDVNLDAEEGIEVEKSAEVLASIQRFLNPNAPSKLSPTAFSLYIDCPLKFYFSKVACLRDEEEIEEKIDDRILGNIFHYAAQLLYADLVGGTSTGELLKEIATSEKIEKAVDEAIRHEYLHDESATAEDYNGDLTLIRGVVIRYLKNVIAYDAAHADFSVVQLEKPVYYDFPFEVGGRKMNMRFEGISDRVDRKADGSVRIIDYKTGSKHTDYCGLDSLFNGKPKERISNITKTILYAMMMYHTSGRDVRPVLYYVRSMYDENYSPLLCDKQHETVGAMYSTYRDEFENLVATKLSELYDPSIPFRQCEDEAACRYCDYRAVCGRVASEE
ncbi:MAG: PD-(D/E)XK nuclease family protein [Rikenellaceae bacterium]|nr:PD-(D/E)XK nuclease family protein [Rikenellaceae bacterium]